jgi:hypothetical protein
MAVTMLVPSPVQASSVAREMFASAQQGAMAGGMVCAACWRCHWHLYIG